MITIPLNIANEIQSQDTNLFPLIVIEGNDTHRFSSFAITLNSASYEPILDKMGGLTESIDIVSKAFAISNFSFTITNINSSFSDKLDTDSLYNKPISAYWGCPSSTTLAECFQVYKGVITKIVSSGDKITFTAEDELQKFINVSVPVATMPSWESIPEANRNMPIPMVYGKGLTKLIRGSGSTYIADSKTLNIAPDI